MPRALRQAMSGTTGTTGTTTAEPARARGPIRPDCNSPRDYLLCLHGARETYNAGRDITRRIISRENPPDRKITPIDAVMRRVMELQLHKI